MVTLKVPLVIRGEVIEDYELEFGGRNQGDRAFVTPNIWKYIDKLVLKNPQALRDLHNITLNEIYDYLDDLGSRLDLETNPHWREAFEASCKFSNISRPVLESVYRNCGKRFTPEIVQEMVETRIGSSYLEGWVPSQNVTGGVLYVRAFGARGVHVIAGNVPLVAAISLIRTAITRSDSIIKLPSNDPLTAVALARTAIEMAPDHPITRHFSVAYWKGGDETVESKIYTAANIEKICAWGGFASIKHIAKYLGPGIDLLTLDPKNSMSLLGKEALADDDVMRAVAARLAVDIGSLDQEACSNARVVFLESGTDDQGIEDANRFGQYVYEALQALPVSVTGAPVRFDPDLLAEIKSILPLKRYYRVFTDRTQIQKTGAIIVSQQSEQVDFPALLYGRVANIVPVDDILDATRYFSAATQTIGIYPSSLQRQIRNEAALSGGQRLVPIGYASNGPVMSAPSDGVEAERRMCKWVSDFCCDPEGVPGAWASIDNRAVSPEIA